MMMKARATHTHTQEQASSGQSDLNKLASDDIALIIAISIAAAAAVVVQLLALFDASCMCVCMYVYGVCVSSPQTNTDQVAHLVLQLLLAALDLLTTPQHHGSPSHNQLLMSQLFSFRFLSLFPLKLLSV